MNREREYQVSFVRPTGPFMSVVDVPKTSTVTDSTPAGAAVRAVRALIDARSHDHGNCVTVDVSHNDDPVQRFDVTWTMAFTARTVSPAAIILTRR